jgi:4a-hydroxytetrahydrobiopterin dehydratase
MTEALSNHSIQDALSELPAWSGDPDGLQVTWTFADFPSAIHFMHDCVSGIEERQHHPEWTNVYTKVMVTLCTHDAGDQVTAKDVELAHFLNRQALLHGGKSQS